MAEWKKIITSGSQAELAGVTGSLSGSGAGITDVKTVNLSGTITNTQLAGSIANSKLVNDSVSFGGVSLDLGQTDATPAFELSDATISSVAIGTSISGSLGANATLIRSLTAAGISGSLGPNATLIRGLTAASISGSISAASVTAAGALMDSELTDLAGVKGVTISTLQVKPSEGAFENGDKTKLDGIEASADVTDTSNVTSAGALMDSELSEIATVKALTAAGISGSFTADSASFSTRITAAEANDGDITRVNITAGNGLGGTQDTTDGANANDVAITAAQTTITSIKEDDLVVGRTSADDSINFSAGDISFEIGGSEKFGIDSSGVVVTGDLTVNGTTTTVNTTNTLVTDRFMLLNSGSNSGDGGIIVQTENDASGSAFVYNDDQSRWGIQQGTKLAQDASTAGAVDGHVSVAVTSDVAAHRKNGNIRVESDEIYIYVE